MSTSGGGGSLPMRAIRNPDLVLKTLQHAREHGVRETVELVRGAVVEDTRARLLERGHRARHRRDRRLPRRPARRLRRRRAAPTTPRSSRCPATSWRRCPTACPRATPRSPRSARSRSRACAVPSRRWASASWWSASACSACMTVQILRANGCRVLGIEPVERRRELAEQLGAERALAPEGATEAASSWSGGAGRRQRDRVRLRAERRDRQRRREDGAPQGPGRAGRPDRPRPRPRAALPARGRHPDLDLVRPRPLRPLLRGGAGSTTRSPTCAGPRTATWRRSCACSRPATCRSSRWSSSRSRPSAPPRRTRRSTAPSRRSPRCSPTTRVATSRRREVVRVSAPAGAPRAARCASRSSAPAASCAACTCPNLKRDPTRGRARRRAPRHDARPASRARSAARETATDWRVGDRGPRDRPRLHRHPPRHARRDRRGRPARRQGRVRREAARPHAARRSTTSGPPARRTTGWRSASTARSRRSRARCAEQVRAAAGPMHVVYRVNAPLPADHWLNDPEQGGGRHARRGAATCSTSRTGCAARPCACPAAALPAPPDVASVESASVTVEYADGSVATVHYSGVGAGSMPKERIEVLRGGRSWVLDDFTALTSYGADGEHTESRPSRTRATRRCSPACSTRLPRRFAARAGPRCRLCGTERRARRARVDRRRAHDRRRHALAVSACGRRGRSRTPAAARGRPCGRSTPSPAACR